MRVSHVFDHYRLDFKVCSNLNDLKYRIADRTCVCLIDEDLYDREVYERCLQSMKTVQTALVTFGPNFAVKEAMGHYRSLTGTLPHVLVKGILMYARKAMQSPQEEAADEHLHNVANAAPYTKLRILIAEDNEINQKVLTRMLTKLGIESFEIVDNGQEAVDREGREAFDVILMDMQVRKQ